MKKNGILKCIQNMDIIYEGTLGYYFKLIFKAPNVNCAYHNFRHMMHVTCSIYEAILYLSYHSRHGMRAARALLIAGLFHDYGHKGDIGNDHENIEKAKQAIREFILDEDRDLLPEIERLIDATEFPHRNDHELSLGEQIIRDADLSQGFDSTWIQQSVFGLSKELHADPVIFLGNQVGFLSSVKFYSPWGNEVIASKRNEKIAEVRELVELLK